MGVDGGGNTVPGAAVPFGFVSESPDTTFSDTSGYSSRGQLLGFSETHESGTGGQGKYGNFRVTPTVGDMELGNLIFPKSDEKAAPGFYSVVIGGPGRRIQAELTSTRLVGFQRYTFLDGVEGNILFDVSARTRRLSTNPKYGSPQDATECEVRFEDATHLSGKASFVGGWNPAPYTLYFYAELDAQPRSYGTYTEHGSQLGNKFAVGAHQTEDYRHVLGAYFSFDTSKTRTVQMKVAVSFISVARAKENMRSEAARWSFAEIQDKAQAAWEKVLGKIVVEGGTEVQRRIFYTSLFRMHYMPHDLTGENVWWSSIEPHYEDFYCLWDTFRTVNPMLLLIEPDRQAGMVQSLLDTYVHTGWLPDCRIAGANGLTQGGSNGDIVVADAVMKGLKGIDANLAFAAIEKNADVNTDDSLKEGRELSEYIRLGYMPLELTRSGSRTMDYAYNDFVAAEVAQATGHHADAQRFLKRSASWKNLWNDESKCIRPRYQDGRWMENFDCMSERVGDGTLQHWDYPFYEGIPLQYSTYVPHDIHGLIAKVGGDTAFVAWLDNLFNKRLYNPGNEPDMLAPYEYIDAGRPDKTADRVRYILSTDYKEGRSGLPGNDDSGTLSAWFLFSAMGFYPNAGQPFYYIGSPVFSRSTLDLGEGKHFMIEASNVSEANRYVQSAKLDGKPLNRAWLKHSEIMAAGKLELIMGPDPSAWGTMERPPTGFDSLLR